MPDKPKAEKIVLVLELAYLLVPALGLVAFAQYSAALLVFCVMAITLGSRRWFLYRRARSR